MSRTITLHTFTVRGAGLFPFDMLRHDRCSPAHQEDSAAIEHTTHRRPGVNTVTLLGRTAPTAGRWKSFGWEVESHSTARQVG